MERPYETKNTKCLSPERTKYILIPNTSCAIYFSTGCEIGYYGDHCRHKCDHCMNKAHCGIKDGRCDGLGCSTYKYEPPLCTGKMHQKQTFF